ncbi:hypothetical protein IWQ62_006158 [Dispira parvispora]|uniref:Globin n=1 Tax=Dispira parvispora TaxID=1520584 RepID=A0A9W8AJ04_9FUNG|nr:hypothetical protein IWQ62_006158 [Dispira parvispora]
MFSLCFGRRKKNKNASPPHSEKSERSQQQPQHASRGNETHSSPIAQTTNTQPSSNQQPYSPTSQNSAMNGAIVAQQNMSDSTAPTDKTSPTMKQHLLSNLDEDLLATVIDKIYEYCLADDRVRQYFRSTNRKRLSDMQLKFLRHAIAGTSYNTTGMRVAHRKMADLQDYHFDAILENWRKAFVDCGLPESYSELILAVAEQSRDDILGRS